MHQAHSQREPIAARDCLWFNRYPRHSETWVGVIKIEINSFSLLGAEGWRGKRLELAKSQVPPNHGILNLS